MNDILLINSDINLILQVGKNEFVQSKEVFDVNEVFYKCRSEYANQQV